jgi:hypothetical protein
MGALFSDLVIIFDDEREITVTYDQRDIARMEALEPPRGTTTRVRALAWSAARRAKKYSGTWEQFNQTDCVEVHDAPGAEASDDDDSLDPGRPDTSGADV